MTGIESQGLADRCEESLAGVYLTLDTQTLDPASFFHQVVNRRERFGKSTVMHGGQSQEIDERYRQSRSLYDADFVREMTSPLRELVQRRHDHILSVLGIARYRQGTTQCTCMTYEDGDFFRRHRDSAPFFISPRKYTWVYYFHREPCQFSGGHLIFYRRGSKIAEIQPHPGLLVVFPADIVHEVTRVSVPSGQFADGRFTISGFVCGRAGFWRRIILKIRRTITSCSAGIRLERWWIRHYNRICRHLRLKIFRFRNKIGC